MTDRAPARMSDVEIAEEISTIYRRLDELEAEFNRRNDTHSALGEKEPSR